MSGTCPTWTRVGREELVFPPVCADQCGSLAVSVGLDSGPVSFPSATTSPPCRAGEGTHVQAARPRHALSCPDVVLPDDDVARLAADAALIMGDAAHVITARTTADINSDVNSGAG
jgi:hypothetical protein